MRRAEINEVSCGPHRAAAFGPAHLVAKGANGTATRLAADSENRVAEVPTRMANGRGTDLPCELRLQLLPGLDADDLDSCLDPLLRHYLQLASRSSEVNDGIAVEPIIAHNLRAPATLTQMK
jgi:hypothetical protein